MKKVKIGLLHTTIRGDEKLLIDAAKRRNVNLRLVDVREQILDPVSYQERFDVVLERCLSTVKGSHAIEFFESMRIPVVNNLSVARLCENKFLTSLTLFKHRVPTPRFSLIFGEEQAKAAVLELGGYPVVIKPVHGSWGRLVAKLNDAHALEAVIEQKLTLGGPHHQAIYMQKYIEKPGRDIRVHVIGGKVIAAIYRKSNHWITNTARGAEAVPCKVDRALKKIALATGKAIGEGVLGLDLFETKNGYVVNEVNHTIEFKNVQRVTGIDIAGTILDYCLKVAKK
ncbi:lysine biosynthesis protein LysX [Candidatus Microgenomates bacterium]|nr:lysine biosynthesis protein LysX [Candidatus Microgenomates bacterium]